MASSTTKTRSKNRGFRTKLFLCFKPVGAVVDDDALEPSTYASILSSALTTVAECNEGRGSWRWRRKNRGDDSSCLWHIIKKALNNTTLLKKIKNRKANRKLERKSGKISKEERKSNGSSLDSSTASSTFCSSSLLTKSSLSSSTTSSSFSSCALTSSSSSSSSPRSTNNGNTFGSFTIKKHIEDTKDSGKALVSKSNNTTLFFSMVSSLVVLILWGKFFAILCTSGWFYIMPRRSRKFDRRGGTDKAVDEFDSVEYKKKIIMKGLLERNHSRLSIDSNIGKS